MDKGLSAKPRKRPHAEAHAQYLKLPSSSRANHYSDTSVKTVQIGLKQLANTQLDQINVSLAGTVIAILPLVILLIVFQKQLVRSLTAGAVK